MRGILETTEEEASSSVSKVSVGDGTVSYGCISSSPPRQLLFVHSDLWMNYTWTPIVQILLYVIARQGLLV